MDQLSKFLIGVGIALWIITIFLPNNGIYSVALVLIFVSYLRAFSKNHPQRYRENEGFLRYYNKVKGFFKGGSRPGSGNRKNQRIFTCPSCKQKIRVPKGKGRIKIKCPKCGTEFIKKS
ncbi:hypothetical protein SAMN02745691_02337 [Parasporobacterium paucivorans DSM 15970]|uniref:Zn-finger containing protein n=2 Tax=Parasporobacterium TaxID=115543 RepID=A0A1M6L674_9FIRM|nr:hypothetical protein SAMN02745691_02337 [Parasporobacterium paucivorans DSM 15970]